MYYRHETEKIFRKRKAESHLSWHESAIMELHEKQVVENYRIGNPDL